ncbi:hypothetical protein L249_5505, partial [Ophiocordyceps polyrhachis-furcata BCC 54312]
MGPPKPPVPHVAPIYRLTATALGASMWFWTSMGALRLRSRSLISGTPHAGLRRGMKSPFLLVLQRNRLRITSLNKETVHQAPCVSAFVRKQLRASHIEDQPSIIPRNRLFVSVRLCQMRHQLLLVGHHGRQPVLTPSLSALI